MRHIQAQLYRSLCYRLADSEALAPLLQRHKVRRAGGTADIGPQRLCCLSHVQPVCCRLDPSKSGCTAQNRVHVPKTSALHYYMPALRACPHDSTLLSKSTYYVRTAVAPHGSRRQRCCGRHVWRGPRQPAAHQAHRLQRPHLPVHARPVAARRQVPASTPWIPWLNTLVPCFHVIPNKGGHGRQMMSASISCHIYRP
jgi:hypothetical protein